MRYFAYDSDGNILQRREGTITGSGSFVQSAEQEALDQTYTYVAGQHIGSGQRSGKVDVLSRLTAYDSSDVGTVGVMVQTGDTLRSLAQRVYGNSNLWYVLAEANALQGDGDLVAGSTLKVPEVKVTANDSNTFKPFNPGEAIGNTAPGLPYIEPPPQQAGCNMLQAIIIIVVAVVVTYFTAGAATGAFLSATGATTLTVGQAVVVGAISGAAGAAASGAVGSAMGAMSFSWRNVAANAIANAATAGIGTAIQQGAMGALGQTLASSSWQGVASRAVLTNLISYGSNKIVGNQVSFNWKNVAASVVSNKITGFATEAIGNAASIDLTTATGQAQADLIGGLVGGIVSAHTRHAFTGDDNDYRMIAVDAFANVFANTLSGQHADTAADEAQRRFGMTASLDGAPSTIEDRLSLMAGPVSTDTPHDLPTMDVRAYRNGTGWDFRVWDHHNNFWVDSMSAIMNRHGAHVDPVVFWSVPPD